MKKIVTIVGVIALSLGMFFSANTMDVSNNMDLASLTALSSADAECLPVKSSSANAYCTASNRCRYDTTARDCHL